MPDIDRALNHALATVGLARVDLSLTRHWIGHGSRTLIKQALEYQQQAAAEPDIDQLLTPFLDYYKANIAVHSRTYPEVNEALSTLHQRGTKLAVVTNKLTELSEPLLQDIGLYEFFDLVYAATPPANQNQIQLRSICLEQFALAPEQVLMVGDSETDVLARPKQPRSILPACGTATTTVLMSLP